MEPNRTLTKTFNVLLFSYLCVSYIVDQLFEPQDQVGVPWDTVYEWSPAFAVIAAFVLIGILLLSGALLLSTFWNKLISDIFRIRRITYDESLAMVLAFSIMIPR